MQQDVGPSKAGFLPPIGKQPSLSGPESSGGVAEEDPWASLQSKYKIGEGKGAAGGGGKKVPPIPTKKNSTFDDDDDDVVMLDAGTDSSKGHAGGGGYATPSAIKLAARGPPPPAAVGGQARAGGWGNGDLAAAGTLMLGDVVPSAPPVRPPGMSSR